MVNNIDNLSYVQGHGYGMPIRVATIDRINFQRTITDDCDNTFCKYSWKLILEAVEIFIFYFFGGHYLQQWYIGEVIGDFEID